MKLLNDAKWKISDTQLTIENRKKRNNCEMERKRKKKNIKS